MLITDTLKLYTRFPTTLGSILVQLIYENLLWRVYFAELYGTDFNV